jgi:anti-anti-sigma factor
MTRWNVVVTVSREGFEDVVLRLDHSPMTIGGSAASDIVLSGPHVSRSHATVTVSAGRLVYRDRSSNGSFVKRQRIDERILAPDDVVTIPPYHLSFALNVDEAPATQPLLDAAIAHTAASVNHGAGAPERGRRVHASFQLCVTKAPGDLQGRTYSFDSDAIQPPVVIGRAADAHLCLELQSISRRHATLDPLDDGRWRISDGGSRNGIAVNGTKVAEAVLSDGDEIAFGPDLSAVFRQRRTSRTDTGAGEGLVVSHRRSLLHGAVMVVGISGRVDGYNYAEFRERVNQLIDAGNHWLVLDFEQCVFCDHVGLSVVLSAKTALDKQRGGLCLMGVDARLRDGLSLLRLDTLLAVEADEAAAVRRLVR